MTKYFIDPYVISLLFQEKEDEKIFDYYRDLASRLAIVAKETTKSFLIGKGYQTENIDEILDTEDTKLLTPELQELISSSDLKSKIETNSDSLLKIYYDQLYPLMSKEAQQELDQYLKTAAETNAMQKELWLSELGNLKEYLQETGSKNLWEAMQKGTNPIIEPAKEKSDEAAKPAGPFTAPDIMPIVPEAEVVTTQAVKPAPAVSPEEQPVIALAPSVETVPTEESQSPDVDWESLIMESMEKNKILTEAGEPVQTQAAEPAPVVPAEVPPVIPLAQPLTTGQEPAVTSQPAEQMVAKVAGQVEPSPTVAAPQTTDLQQSTADKLAALGVDMADTAPQQPAV